MSKSISDIDKNLKIETNIQEKDIVFFDASRPPFDIYGLIKDDASGKSFVRMKKADAEKVNEGVEVLSTNTAGGRLRFKTNSRYVAIKVESEKTGFMPHMTMAGSSGFDMYEKISGEYIYTASFLTDWDLANFAKNGGYENITYFPEKRLRDLTLNFPHYNSVEKLYIGLEKGSVIEHGGEYSRKNPIVFYGSSITQGGCASRPGNAYANIISRRYDTDILNLGFSGSGKGERAIAEYIASLDMSVFVYDYDYNADNAEHLEKTHKPMFDIIRKAHPNTPIIIMSMPKMRLNDEEKRRKAVIKSTYDNAIASGDKNVYFIPGDKIFKIHGGDSCTVDGCHPNDLGFMCMADAVSDVLDKIFN